VHFEENHKYVLVGRNGEGKSTLLRAYAEKSIPGVPWNMRMLLLGQSESVETETEEMQGKLGSLEIGKGKEKEKGETVLEHVLRADRERERFKREAEGEDDV
jgi:ATP-binding cassette subfamily F protein 3